MQSLLLAIVMLILSCNATMAAWYGDPPSFKGGTGGIVDAQFVNKPDSISLLTIERQKNIVAHIGQPITIIIKANTAAEGTVVAYHLVHGAPAGAQIYAINPEAALASHINPDSSGVFTFTPHATGTFPVTIVGIDSAKHSASASFHITVLK